MKKRYLVTILLGAALLAWNCGENSSSSGTSGSENLPATSTFLIMLEALPLTLLRVPSLMRAETLSGS